MIPSTRLSLGLGLAGLVVLTNHPAARANPGLSNDPEASPLYGTEVRRAFSDMAARDSVSALAHSDTSFVLSPGEVIVVEGTTWHRQTAGGQAVDTAATPAGKKDPVPLETMDSPTCVRTCASYPTCSGASTCNGGATCLGAPTCMDAGITCIPYPTCGAVATCSGTSTCVGYATCNNAPTCIYYFTCPGYGTTCSGSTCSSTCGGNSTCINTCNLGNCSAPVLYSLVVSNDLVDPAQHVVQMSFNAFGSVKYTVQYSTNVNALHWSNVFSKLGDGSATTFAHTNSAPRAFYRVSMQNP